MTPPTRHPPRRALAFVACLAQATCLVLATDSALAQDADPLPTLDELLGTDGEASDSTDATDELPADMSREELDRLLSGQEIVDEFEQAIDLMQRSAVRLTATRDTGLTTQRMQEDVLAKLDKLIADAQRRGQQSSSQSSSSQQQQEGRQQQPQQQSQPSGASNENRGESSPPGGQDGPLGPEQAADLAAWGNLPARFRDALVQGATDRFSATYRRLTEEYYRRLAEDPEE